MGKTWIRWVLLGVLSIGCPFFLTCTVCAQEGGKSDVSPSEMMQQFMQEYASADFLAQAVFEKYLEGLGVERLLAFLETTYRDCHLPAHDLGRAIFAEIKAVEPALRMCSNRCNFGCMHGILREAFGDGTLESVTKQMVILCSERREPQTAKPGSCVHGMGHALMVASGYDIEKALSACTTFPSPAQEYFCATGVFMEQATVGPSGDKANINTNQQPRGLHYPCDTYTRFPAACYRYHVVRILRTLGQETTKVVDECLALSRPLRLGCFHGLGYAHVGYIAENPPLLAKVCRAGTDEDQAVCIEGAIENLGELDEERALAACTFLDGENTAICRAAAREKKYRPHKPTMALYHGPWNSPASE